MRVALVHSFYSASQPSGENEVVQAEQRALEQAGAQVRLFASHTDERSRRRSHAIRTAVSVPLGRGDNPAAEILDFSPDVLHVHNLFPNIATRWLNGFPVPVVATVHNYRSMCAKGTFFREGQTCYECVHSGPHRGLLHACYRGSRPATLPLTLAQARTFPWLPRADWYIALSHVQVKLLVQGGVDAAKISIVPHFLPRELDAGAGAGGSAFVFVGRLDEQKGLHVLMQTWPQGAPLVVVGDGPLRAELEIWASSRPNVRLLGALNRAEVQVILARAAGLLFPSRSAEPFGLVYVEALAAGVPVLAAPGTAVAEFVADDQTGVVVQDYSRLSSILLDLDRARLRTRAVFESKYSEDRHVAQLLQIYELAAAAASDSSNFRGRRG